MDAQRSAVFLMALALACTHRDDRSGSSPMQEGRTYTAWLYENQYRKLWDRFSPEMQQTFGSVADFASFTNRAVQNLGVERGRVDEKVKEGEPFRVYSRSAAFDKSRHRMLIEWSLTKDGAVTGLVVRPELPDSAPAGRQLQ